MKCTLFAERYLGTGAPGELPLRARLHLLLCSSCRREARHMEQALDALRRSVAAPQVRDLSREIMERIALTEPEWERRTAPIQQVALINWIAVGLFIVAGFFLAEMNGAFIWMIDVFGRDLDIMISIVLGVVFTVYAAVFVASHMDLIAARLGIDRGRHFAP